MEEAKMVNDFLTLIAELWDVEQFNMWNPEEHSALAYLFDRSFDNPNYHTEYKRWMRLARKKKFNKFAWTISKAIVSACMKDERISQSDKDNLVMLLKDQKRDCKDHCLSGFGLVEEEYVPEWFFELFEHYFGLEELKRENALVAYMENECSMSANKAKEVYQMFYDEHYDILNEFYFYVKNNRFTTFNPIAVKGFSAQRLVESYGLSPFGAYNFLVYLRESPDAALVDLRKGLPEK